MASQGSSSSSEMPLVLLAFIAIGLIMISQYKVSVKTSNLQMATNVRGSSSSSSSANMFTLSSSAFAAEENIPKLYTCTDEQGNDQVGISPPLEWKDPPTGTTQYLLTLSTTYGKTNQLRVDWVVYNIPSETKSIPENGSETIGKIGGTYPGVPIEYKYRAPCSPISGVHTFKYTIYALKGDLNAMIVDGTSKDFAPVTLFRNLLPTSPDMLNAMITFSHIASDIITTAQDNNMILSSAEMELSYCRCGCDTDTHGGGVSCLTT